MNRGPILADASGCPQIRELEVSITHRCNLACAQCGFMVPAQPPLAHGDVVEALTASLGQLQRLGIRIGTLVVLGGEPTLDGRRLERALRGLRAVGNFDRLEVVSNGLSPQGLTPESLRYIDRFVISVYFHSPELEGLWRRYIASVAPAVELQFRRHEDGWDQWTGAEQVDDSRAQELFVHCWYRRHCVTVERGRLFSCSRIPKLARDDEGLGLTSATRLADVSAYLDGERFLPSCRTCVPMMELARVAPGVQPDDRVARLQLHAIRVLGDRLDGPAAGSGGRGE